MRETVLQFSDLKRMFITAAEHGAKSVLNRPINITLWDRHIFGARNDRGNFYGNCNGDTIAQMVDYLENGYEIPGLDLTASGSPIVEYTRGYYNEEMGEYDYGLDESGVDECFYAQSPMQSLPGMRVVISTGYSGGTNVEVINKYFSFCLQAINTLEASGVNCEVIFQVTNTCMTLQNRGLIEYNIPIKKPGEISDFLSWTAIIAPGAYRTLGWAAKIIANDRLNEDTESALGNVGSNPPRFTVSFDTENDEMKFGSPRSPYSFDNSDMEKQFKAVLDGCMTTA